MKLNEHILLSALTAACFLIPLPALAITKCVINGKITYSDVPCEGAVKNIETKEEKRIAAEKTREEDWMYRGLSPESVAKLKAWQEQQKRRTPEQVRADDIASAKKEREKREFWDRVAAEQLANAEPCNDLARRAQARGATLFEQAALVVRAKEIRKCKD